MSASAEYGAFDTAYATLAGGVVTDRIEAGLTGSYYDSDGFSAAETGSEADGFRQWQLAGRGRFRVSEAFSLTANGRYADGRLEQDGYPAPLYAFADTDDLQDTEEYSGRIGADYQGERLTLRGGYALSDTTRLYTGRELWRFPVRDQGRAGAGRAVRPLRLHRQAWPSISAPTANGMNSRIRAATARPR